MDMDKMDTDEICTHCMNSWDDCTCMIIHTECGLPVGLCECEGDDIIKLSSDLPHEPNPLEEN